MSNEFKYVIYNKHNSMERIVMDWDGNIRVGYAEMPLGFFSLEVAWLFHHRLKDVFPHIPLIIGKSYNTVSFETKYQNISTIG